MINDELRAIQSVLNETSRIGNEGSVPVTLIVGGQVITGFIVSQAAYQRTREASAADDLTRRVATALNKVDSVSPDAGRKLQHIYLRGARFVLPGIHIGSSILKLAIDAIDGFMFGIEGDDEGLVLGRAPVLSDSGSRPQASSSDSGSNSSIRPTVEPGCSPSEFADLLRKVAAAVDAGDAFRLIVAGSPVSVPAEVEFTVEHAVDGDGESLGFRIRWKRDSSMQ
jgi:amphi-Trp domain-containing protein